MAEPKIERVDESILEKQAKEIAGLRYEQVAYFIECLEENIRREAEKDEDKGRLKLASTLFDASDNLEIARKYVSQAWKICKPYMPKD